MEIKKYPSKQSCIKEEVRENIEKHIKVNEKIKIQNTPDVAKAVLGGKFITQNAYIRAGARMRRRETGPGARRGWIQHGGAESEPREETRAIKFPAEYSGDCGC